MIIISALDWCDSNGVKIPLPPISHFPPPPPPHKPADDASLSSWPLYARLCDRVLYVYMSHNDTYSCAANFSFAQLAKRKSLGRSKPATNSQAQALQHTVWNVSTISKPYWTAFYRNKLSTTRCEWVRLFISRLVQSTTVFYPFTGW